jgi:esterase/lipase
MRSFTDWVILNYFVWKKFDKKRNLKVNKRIIGQGDKAVFFFPYWTGKSKFYDSTVKKLGKDYTCVLYDYPKEIFSKDAQVSIKYLIEVLTDAKKTIQELKKEGVKEITLVGSSLGSDISLALAKSTKVDKIVINMLDRNFVKPIFESPAFPHLRKYYEKHGITYKMMNKIYRFISPEYNINTKKEKDVKMLILISKHDVFCTYDELKPLLKKFDAKGVKYELHINGWLGHVMGMYWNIKFSRRILNFIKK